MLDNLNLLHVFELNYFSFHLTSNVLCTTGPLHPDLIIS